MLFKVASAIGDAHRAPAGVALARKWPSVAARRGAAGEARSNLKTRLGVGGAARRHLGAICSALATGIKRNGVPQSEFKLRTVRSVARRAGGRRGDGATGEPEACGKAGDAAQHIRAAGAICGTGTAIQSEVTK